MSESSGNSSTSEGGAKVNKPLDTDFRQQRLKAWQPVLTPPYVISIFLAIGLFFIPIGVVLLNASNDVVEVKQQYDEDYIKRLHVGDAALSKVQNYTSNANKYTIVSFTAPKEMKAPVYVYYELDGFYQNHRRYVKSRSDSQLSGKTVKNSSLQTSCDPLSQNVDGQYLWPCGLIANSFFNDVITLANGSKYTMNENDIAWKIDRQDKFKNPGFYNRCVNVSGAGTCTAQDKALFNQYQWLYETYPGVVTPAEGVEDEHFIVWMRTAALPNFRKLYGRVEKTITKGSTISFNITTNFNVSAFGGKKSLVLSTTSWIGGKNTFLGYAYIVVGSLSLVIALLFFIKHQWQPRKLGDTNFLVWKSNR